MHNMSATYYAKNLNTNIIIFINKSKSYQYKLPLGTPMTKMPKMLAFRFQTFISTTNYCLGNVVPCLVEMLHVYFQFFVYGRPMPQFSAVQYIPYAKI